MKAIRVLSGVVPGPSLPSGGPDPVGKLEELVRSCTACAVERCNPSEPMIASDTVLRPWQKVGMDMFMYNKATYLLVVDYASSYGAKLAATPSPDVILHLRSISTRHGIPENVVSDNGTQYASYEFAQFASEEGFIHVANSPRYPQSNGKAEWILQTVTAMLKKSVDPYGALLTYRTTSLECGDSPAQLLMGRQLRTSIIVMASTLQPRWNESKQLRDRQENIKTRQTVDYVRYHRAQHLSTLSAGDPVWIQDAKIGGTVVGKAGTPRSYLVQTPTTCLRRNRRHLVPTPNVTLEPMLIVNRRHRRVKVHATCVKLASNLTELRLLATVQQNTNFRSHFESLTVYKSTYFDYLRTSFKANVKFVIRKRNV